MSKYVHNCSWPLLVTLVVGLAACPGPEAVRSVDGGADYPIAVGLDGPPAAVSPHTVPNAARCFSPDDCASGFCVDGLCCDTACAGSCMSCASSARPGICSPADPGTDPRDDCSDDGPGSCGQDGTCDGTGACRKYPAGLVCQPASCVGSTLTFAALCDGAGTCLPTSSVSCGAYACGPDGQCRDTCATDADCAPGRGCVNGACGPKPPGAQCVAATDCASGHCEQGTCCTTACVGTCRSCALAGSQGRCTSVPAGSDPLAQCADQGAASCGTDGACDGKGACHLYATGSVCAPASCTAGRATLARTCDGAGTCQPAATVDCAPFTCGTSSSCGSSCATSDDCAAGFECIGGVCRKRATGAACTAGSQCATGFCQQGVCCASSCSSRCRSCALAGSQGACRSVPAGQDPLQQCTNVASTNPCGTDGACDGAGACRLRAAGTTCGAQTCSGANLSLAGSCDGKGTCVSGGTQSCAPFLCTAAGCKTSCTGTAGADCAPGNVCTQGTCGLPPAPPPAVDAGSD